MSARQRRVAGLTVVVLAAMGAGQAQSLEAQTTSGPCTVTPAAASGADACQKARDLFGFVVPQIGIAVSSGNPVLGEGGTLGGWPKRAFSFRVSAVDGQLPKNAVPISVTGSAVGSDFGAARTPIPLPSADAAIGIFPGIPLGLTNTLGVDVLLGASYLPTVKESTFEVAPRNGGFAFQYGVRVGALQESSFIPGLSVSYMRRKLPTVDLGYTPNNDTLTVTGTSVTSNALRVVASKRFAIFGIAAGVGRDEIEGSASMRASVNETVLATNQRFLVQLPDLRYTTTRNTAFVNASIGLGLARVVGEYGWSGEGTVRETVNQFGGRKADEGYRYGSLGIAFRF
ncbi:hypothetical protein [Gemmatimonas groenlandica]|uniref:Outer membrane protein beta-barrel domain-containing protein n=1 Tax=Gemmatimonas groenlandica TaxID=2732249 RepID=A0A6M4IP99_9BACT|nr:hypothetical protein [Gemmatimonas groenlandica]QJR35256.1 hypothetical protein HKW67_06945 [Gemmatimonas groenlandica]